MAIALLTPNLSPPQLRAGLMPRPRLIGSLQGSLRLGRRLALVSAPAS